ncbi:MAG: hypothetical protein QM648_11830 [Solirubrobacterales bacterium]
MTGALKRQPWEVWALTAIVVVGALLRLWIELLWRPGFLGFPDSSAYFASVQHPFADLARPPGYPLAVKLLWQSVPRIEAVILIQHLLGLASIVLAYLLARMLAAPRWAALIPAAAVSLGGAQVMLEHSFLSIGPFTFLLLLGMVATCAAARLPDERVRARFGLFVLAGSSLGLAVIMRTYAVLVIVPLLAHVVASEPRLRPSLVGAAALTLPVIAIALAVIVASPSETGRSGIAPNAFYNYYGRVATFADCTKFTPPAGTALLCPSQAPAARKGQRYWDFDAQSPLVENFGDSFSSPALPSERRAVKRFARAAAFHQPGAYLSAVARDAWRMFDPSFPLNPNPAVGNSEAGPGPDQMRTELVDPVWSDRSLMLMVGSSASQYGSYRSLDGFNAYESVARFSGVRLAIPLILCLLAPWLVAAGAHRRGALMLLTSVLILLIFPLLVNMYNYRYVVPVLPLIWTGAALAIAGLAARIEGRRAQRGVTPTARM